jgi:hypothetical protein
MPGTTFATRTAVDGSDVEFSSPIGMSFAFTSDVMAEMGDLGGRHHRVCTGPRGFAHDTAFDPEVSLGMRFTHDLAFQAGRLRLGEGRPTVGPDGAQYWERLPDGGVRVKPYRIAIWEGRTFSFYSHMYGGESEDLLAALTRLVIREGRTGLTCTPKDSNTRFVKQASVMQVMPGIGDLYCLHLTAHTARSVPRHPGTKVVGGELYAHDIDHPEKMHLTLVNDTCVTQIVPDHDVSESDLMAVATELVVNWRSPS